MMKRKKETEDDDGSSDNQDINNQFRLQLPKEFYCPITGEVFQCPVVLSDGDSYERSAIEAFGYVPSRLYLNRSLQKIIQELHKDEENGNKEEKKIENCELLTSNYQPLPDVFYCPITMDLMIDPVIDNNGMTYERQAIMQWIQVNGTSPITREATSTEDLYPNNAIYTLIHHEFKKSDEFMHPSIRKWKNRQNQKQQQQQQDEKPMKEEGEIIERRNQVRLKKWIRGLFFAKFNKV